LQTPPDEVGAECKPDRHFEKLNDQFCSGHFAIVVVPFSEEVRSPRLLGLTANECQQSAEVCKALAHKTKELDTRAALLGFAYEFRTVAKRLERDERKLMVRAASDGMQK
jgi:hypothetical protein